MKYKILILNLALFGLTSSVFSQDKKEHKLPPMKDLPKAGEVKEFYELPEICDYQVFDSLGNFISKGHGEFVDVTTFKKGNYFIKYLDKTFLYKKED